MVGAKPRGGKKQKARQQIADKMAAKLQALFRGKTSRRQVTIIRKIHKLPPVGRLQRKVEAELSHLIATQVCHLNMHSARKNSGAPFLALLGPSVCVVNFQRTTLNQLERKVLNIDRLLHKQGTTLSQKLHELDRLLNLSKSVGAAHDIRSYPTSTIGRENIELEKAGIERLKRLDDSILFSKQLIPP